ALARGHARDLARRWDIAAEIAEIDVEEFVDRSVELGTVIFDALRCAAQTFGATTRTAAVGHRAVVGHTEDRRASFGDARIVWGEGLEEATVELRGAHGEIDSAGQRSAAES